jgi:hypothetical protein
MQKLHEMTQAITTYKEIKQQPVKSKQEQIIRQQYHHIQKAKQSTVKKHHSHSREARHNNESGDLATLLDTKYLKRTFDDSGIKTASL